MAQLPKGKGKGAELSFNPLLARDQYFVAQNQTINQTKQTNLARCLFFSSTLVLPFSGQPIHKFLFRRKVRISFLCLSPS